MPQSADTVKETQNSATTAALKGWQIAVLWLLRIATGGVFVVSGFVKMVDPWGFIFKIEEYLGVWDVWQPRTVVLMASLLIAGYEFVLGLLLAMGCYKRSSVIGLLLNMAVMLPLTFYIWIANPVSDCGCFGDFLILSNGLTFLKNVVITAALVALLVWNSRLRQAMFSPAIQWMVGAWISLYIMVIGLYGYNVQPMLDFRSFPVGSLLSDSLAPENTGDDDAYLFRYTRNGEFIEVGIDELPDSTWEFVDRIERPVGSRDADDSQAQFSQLPKENLAVFDLDGEVTDEVIVTDGPQLLLVIPEPKRAELSFTYTLNEIYEYADSVGVPMIGLLGGDEQSMENWRDMSMAEYQLYMADDTQLKSLARGVMSLVLLRDGVVESKVAIGALTPEEFENPDSEDAFFESLSVDPSGWLEFITVFFGGTLLILYLFQGMVIVFRNKVLRAWRRRKRSVKKEQKN